MAENDEELLEIRCLWQMTDYGYISLVSASRGYGERKLGSYQDAIVNDEFANIRRLEAEVHPNWPLVESIIKVSLSDVEALFTDGTVIDERR